MQRAGMRWLVKDNVETFFFFFLRNYNVETWKHETIRYIIVQPYVWNFLVSKSTHSPLESRIIQSNSNPTMTYQHSQKSQSALSLIQTFPMLCTRWISICLIHDRLTILLFCAFFDTWRALSSMASSTLLSLLLFSMHSLMLIGQEIPLM